MDGQSRTLLLIGLLCILPVFQSYPIKAMPLNLQSLLNSDESLASDLRRLDQLVENGRFRRSLCREGQDCIFVENIRELVPFV